MPGSTEEYANLPGSTSDMLVYSFVSFVQKYVNAEQMTFDPNEVAPYVASFIVEGGLTCLAADDNARLLSDGIEHVDLSGVDKQEVSPTNLMPAIALAHKRSQNVTARHGKVLRRSSVLCLRCKILQYS